MIASVALRTALRSSSRATAFATRTAVPSSSALLLRKSTPAFALRTYASGSGLSSSDIQSRITDVLKSFEKVDPSKVSRAFDGVPSFWPERTADWQRA